MTRKTRLKTKLKTLRLLRWLSQRELAEKAGTTQATICEAERGYGIDLVTALRIAAAMNRPVEEIWRLRKQ